MYKFEVSSVSRYGDITWGVKFYKGSPDTDHAPFREDFSSAGWDWLWKITVPNLKSLGSPVTSYEWRCKMQKMGWFGVVSGHWAVEVMGNVTIR